jgi:hypothetical protein
MGFFMVDLLQGGRRRPHTAVMWRSNQPADEAKLNARFIGLTRRKSAAL